jgi:hypothetical protein
MRHIVEDLKLDVHLKQDFCVKNMAIQVKIVHVKILINSLNLTFEGFSQVFLRFVIWKHVLFSYFLQGAKFVVLFRFFKETILALLAYEQVFGLRNL